MDGSEQKKRTEERLSIAVGTGITLRGWPLLSPAVTVNLSASGALLRFEEQVELEVGEVVVCEFAKTEVEATSGAPAQWARGEILRVAGTDVALRFVESSFALCEGKAHSSLAA